MARQLEHDRRGFHYVVALPRLFPEALEAVAHLDLVVVRPRLRSSSGGGATRVTAPIRELIHNEERFRIAVFRVRPRRCGRDDPWSLPGSPGSARKSWTARRGSCSTLCAWSDVERSGVRAAA